MNVLDLFSGIGGFSLGLERAGMRTVAFCEIEPFCQAVLRKHWPNIPIYDDVRTLTAERLAEDGIGPIDVICGGFPCQDLSRAGLWRTGGTGMDGERTGLFSEIVRLVGNLRPQFIVLENVSDLVGNGLGRCLRSLYELGFDAEWHVIPAVAIGAPHYRERVWIIAYPGRKFGTFPILTRNNVKEVIWRKQTKWRKNRQFPQVASVDISLGNKGVDRPRSHRVDDGISDWAHRLKACGNSVLPQIPEIIGRAIMQAEGLA